MNARAKDGMTPLHVQATEPDTEQVIKALLAAGADPDLKDKWGCTALNYATDRQEQDKIQLLSEGQQDTLG